MIKYIELISGYDKQNTRESFDRILFEQGKVYAIVGPTGSGKTQLLEDIESLTDGESISKRHVLVNGTVPDAFYFHGSRSQWIALLSQSMNFVLDLSVMDFLKMRSAYSDEIISEANALSGEPILPHHLLTALSGGQSRALMVADVAFNSQADVILLDELENAGIDRIKALNLLTKRSKIVLLVTHDPMLSLLADCRVVLENGGIKKIVQRNSFEEETLELMKSIDL